ncbi:hypothetical protein tinsulaeT_24380 [Thalassotalea insulae]|uniref:Uncharacterized protein n=1 Tax=Thalassotalea insulae TaxID=2056778 RepID=A0ABQ6GT26_9GAMM|nr:transporter substrate-binding domain-containing protein [Thalassotalea insulae]GLX79098.1 hypothetical protein tinsulaeT_24380 [Thalassotalea insulae]
MKWILLFLAVIFLTVSGQASSNNELSKAKKQIDEPLRLKYEPSGSNAWFPYYIHSQQRKGIVPEIIDLILQRANIIGEEVALPAARTNLALENGDIDFDFINPAWLPADVPIERYVFSAPIIPVKESYIALTANAISLLTQKMKQSDHVQIGTVRGYYYHDDNLFQRVDFSSEKNLIMALQQRRVSYAICDDITAQYWSNVLSVPIVIGQSHSDGFLRIRLRKELAVIIPRLNRAINELKHAGVIAKIIDSYL